MDKQIMLGLGALLLVSTEIPIAGSASTSTKPAIDFDGAVRIPALSLPLSRYMSEEAKRKFILDARRSSLKALRDERSNADRNHDADYFGPIVDRARARYPVTVETLKIAGIPTQVVVPREGIAPRNRERVLINLHGGGFVSGAGLGSLAESVPIAGVGRIKVIAIDYRMAPRHHFPAASQDVAQVYSALLEQYAARYIGIYGCSSGGTLAAMAIAWLQKEKLPTPGAVGIFSAGAYASWFGSPGDPNTWGGDSAYTGQILLGKTPLFSDAWLSKEISGRLDYLANVSANDPLASPALSEDILAKFPPTLIISGTRAFDMSAGVQTHRLLSRVGIEADLHLWDGLGHCFFYDVDLPESREAYTIIANFFDRHLRPSL